MAYNYRVWGFGEDIGLRGLLAAGDAIGDPQPEAFVHGLLRAWLGRGVGSHAEDHVGPGRVLLDFHLRTGDAAFLDAALALGALHAGFPQGRCGERLHRHGQPGFRHQIWVDCMDMDGPFLARLAVASGDGRFAINAVYAVLSYARLLQDEASGLFRHGHESDSGPNGQYWARGNGWALMGMIETLAALPRGIDGADEIEARIGRLAAGLAAQQSASGLWHTIVDDPASYEESTLAAMAAYAFREAIAHDILPHERFADIAATARNSLPALVAADGTLGLVSAATPVAERHVYITRPFGLFPWGQGPLLLALTQEFP